MLRDTELDLVKQSTGGGFAIEFVVDILRNPPIEKFLGLGDQAVAKHGLGSVKGCHTRLVFVERMGGHG